MPHGAPELVAYGILVLFSAFLIVHWMRRATRPASVTEPVGRELTGDLTAFDKVQRLFHWATTVVLILVHSAFPSWVLVHVIFSGLLAGLLVVHVTWDVGKLRAFHRMWPRLQDARDALLRGKNFLSIAKQYPRMSKYDLFMKNFHIYLIISFAVLAVTGIYQYLYAPWWTVIWFLHYQIEPAWRPTVIHDIFGFSLIALLIGHVYFAFLKINWPLLKAMTFGKISRDEANRRYRPDELE
ncbi:MAG: cytochrome b/b6 domain-containing protein [Thaumarchaeota archaeon]|nr:MAG: cytochrome b/b6 domain-containing protein [Nitrososphaerota archaeon]